jgi:hypothetical protein
MVQTPEIFAESNENTPRVSPCHCGSGAGARRRETVDPNALAFRQDLLLRMLTAGTLSMTGIQSREFIAFMSFSNPVLGTPHVDAFVEQT